jgi:hypothetical protein
MKRISIIGALACVTALAIPGIADAKTPYLAMFRAKAEAVHATQGYARWREDGANSWDNELSIYWDDYSRTSSCTRKRRNVVDCLNTVTLYESDSEDPDNYYTASETCRWPLRVVKGRYGVWAYQRGTEGGDYGSITCTGWYGEDDGEPTY